MKLPATDTIAAIATAPGRGGIGIVRVSGPQTQAIARGLLGAVPEPRRAGLHEFLEDYIGRNNIVGAQISDAYHFNG